MALLFSMSSILLLCKYGIVVFYVVMLVLCKYGVVVFYVLYVIVVL